MGGRAVAGTLALLISALSSAACSKCGNESKSTDDTAAEHEAPAPAPDALLADLYVAAPNTVWTKAQRGIGGAVGILPASAGGIVCAGLGLDASVGSEIDGAMPWFGVVTGDPVSPSWAFAMKLVDARHARSALIDGDTARFSARDVPGVSGMTELVGRGGPPLAVSAAIFRGYLIVAHAAEDLTKLAPYLTRTLPARPLPEGAIVADVPRSALTKVFGPKLSSTWGELKSFLLAEDERARKMHGGRAPDYGDPKAIVATLDALVGRRIEVTGDLEKLRLSLDVGDDGAVLTATMTPAEGAGPASKWLNGMHTGDASLLSALPAQSALAVLLRDGDEERAAQGKELEKTLTTSLGERLGEADAKKLHEVVEDATKARGEVFAASLVWDEPEGLLVRAPVRDTDAAGRAVRGALDLARSSPFKEMLHLREITTTNEDVADFGKVSLATFVRSPGASGEHTPGRPPRRALPAGFDAAKDAGVATADAGTARKVGADAGLSLVWLATDGALTAAIGDESLVTLRTSGKPDRRLADEPVIVRALAPLGNTASSIVVGQPLRFDPKRADLPAAPVVFAVGRREKDAYMRLSVAYGVLREVARSQMGM